MILTIFGLEYSILFLIFLVRSVLLIEDLSEWKSKICTILPFVLTKDEVIMCLKNMAIMHARVWGNKKNDISWNLG